MRAIAMINSMLLIAAFIGGNSLLAARGMMKIENEDSL